jgi:hypothetical protein
MKRIPKVGDRIYWVSPEGDSAPGEIIRIGKNKVKAHLNTYSDAPYETKWIQNFQYQDGIDF